MLILEAVAGPVTGRRIELRTGTALVVGRTTKSHFVISEDLYLSGQHFALEFDGEHGRVKDLASSNGTFVNGNRITEAAICDGDLVAAGGTTFTVRVDASVSPPDPARFARTGPTLK